MLQNTSSNWNDLYRNNQSGELTWYEPLPLVSVRLITTLNLPKDASIIDVGVGDSMLVKYLLALGYRDITVADFSFEGLARTKRRLGDLVPWVKWIHGDILELTQHNRYDLWHDRATFQFLNTPKEEIEYIKIAYNALKSNGHMILAEYTRDGPILCHGFKVNRYSQNRLNKLLCPLFENTGAIFHKHITPSNELLPFSYHSYKKTIFPDPLFG